MLVRISGELKSDVSSHIHHRLQPKEYKLEFGVEANVEQTFKLPSSHPVITQIIWGEHLPLKDRMPKEWLTTLSYYGGEVTLRLNVDETPINVRVQGEAPTVPPRCDGAHRFSVSPDICPEIKGFYDLKVREKEFIGKWQRIKQDIRAFLESAKSLNAALKAWPGLRAFIPDEYLQRVDTKVERKASTEIMEQKLAEIDRDMATAAATAAILAA
jgi:hypothetical protein